ncbi:LPS assembly lipoprotein LptE [Sedimenticola sp.]|uniref:LPS-assembly lipoprotein LptE n=1 Tax=Sedimenticola sp. TaxID=1940285 RepID=UPI003D0F23F2
MIGKKLLSLALLVWTLSLLQGCGFKLRGSVDLPSHIGPVYIQGLGEYDLLRRELSQMLSFSDIPVAKDAKGASSILTISNRASDRRVISVDGNGNVAEYELHEGAKFSLRGTDKRELVKEQSVSAITTYLNSETQVLGKQQEEGTLRNDLQRDLASQIMRRLQAQL